MNLKGFRDCLAEYTVHSLLPWYGLLASLVVLNSAARWCNTTQFLQNCEILLACVHGRRKDFFQGALVDCSKSCSRDGPEVVKFVFYHSNIKKTTFFAEIP